MTYPTKKLGEVIDVNFGERITRTNNSGNKYPVYGGGGESFRTDRFNRENEYVVSRFAIAENCVRFVEGKFWLMDSGGTFSIKNESAGKLDKKFVGNVLLMKQKEIYNCARGGAQKNIDVDFFKKIKIPLPPLPIQKQIVERLDKIAEAQKLNEDLIKKTDELFQSLLYKELNPAGPADAKAMAGKKDWEVKKLNEVLEINYGKGLDKSKRVDSGKFFAYGSNGPVYRTNESLTSGEIIVIGRKGTAGALYFVSEPCWPIDTTFFAKPNNDALLKFIYYLLQTKKLPRLAIVTGVPGINRTTLANINVQLPPLKIQKQIVTKLSAVQDYKKQLLEQKTKLKELFNSVLFKSMKGEL